MKKIAVGDIMTRQIISVRPDDSLYKCAKTLVKKRVNTLLVTNSKTLLGIISARDIMWVITKKPKVDLRKIKAIDIAKKKVAVTQPSADITNALDKMRAVNFRRLPVVSNGELIGVVTLKDILRIEPDLYHEIGHLSDIREEKIKLEKADIEPYTTEGPCESCDAFAELFNVEGQALCSDCKAALE
jgi:CBS domain-containing protein